MRHYHVLVEFSEPVGHARAFAHISESQVRHNFIFPWTTGNLPIGPDRDVMASQVSRLRVFRAAGPEELGSVDNATMRAVGRDVTDRFLSELGIRAKSPTTGRPLLYVMAAAVVAGTRALLHLRKSDAANVSRRDVSGSPSQPRVSHV
ncbi:hypothetical protein [Pseudoxanthomonas sp. UTMC 1351]|uniref:hypothetical protein n=1 Tax=Pseudoxanthomonas sp. UTMC 1351 TaxID=2695853 RepID=UPI0034CE649B